jgi:GNAT superfamily N-acetyltransferase
MNEHARDGIKQRGSGGGSDLAKLTVVTATQRDRYCQLNDRLQASQLPVFLNHDEVVARYWDSLTERFPEYQFLLVDGTGEPLGRGHSIPLRFDDAWSNLPDGGLDWALETGFQDQEDGREPNLVSALFIVISKDHLGRGLSYRMLTAMRKIAGEQGLEHLIAPVRPSSKSQFPLIPMEDYCRWTRPDGSPFDPWIRVHIRCGGTMLHPCSQAMVVRDTVARWSHWTGIEFPGDGSYVVPGGLVPLVVDRCTDQGAYLEPGVWILHRTDASNE